MSKETDFASALVREKNAIIGNLLNTNAELLEAIERYLAARKALEAAPTHNGHAFDAAMAEHDAALAELSRVATLARGNPA